MRFTLICATMCVLATVGCQPSGTSEGRGREASPTIAPVERESRFDPVSAPLTRQGILAELQENSLGEIRVADEHGTDVQFLVVQSFPYSGMRRSHVQAFYRSKEAEAYVPFVFIVREDHEPVETSVISTDGRGRTLRLRGERLDLSITVW